MSFKSQPSSHRSNSRQFSKTAHAKKMKDKKKRAGAKYLWEETSEATLQEVADKTINALNKLGIQIFALSPFSQYFDDWLINLKQAVSEFETNSIVNVDQQFEQEVSQAFLDIEAALAEKRLQESNLTDEAKALADNNHLIVEADKEYAEKTRENSNKRNAEVQRLSNKIRQLEEDLAVIRDLKISFYKFNEKKRAQQKLQQITQDLAASKNELEITLGSFSTEQEKLHDSYEKRKQELNENSDRLHKELEKLETDTSIEVRQTACNTIINTLQKLLQRSPVNQSEDQ
jgi:chromosome segregation ATPase